MGELLEHFDPERIPAHQAVFTDQDEEFWSTSIPSESPLIKRSLPTRTRSSFTSGDPRTVPDACGGTLP